MKKALFFVTMVLGFAFFIACKSDPPPPPPPPPPTRAPVAPEALEKFTEEMFKEQEPAPLPAPRLILEGSRTYTVVRGDTLASIARKLYGDAYYYPLILVASKDVVSDPDEIEVGMVLTIPDLPRNLDDAGARARIKESFNEAADIEGRRGRGNSASGFWERAADF